MCHGTCYFHFNRDLKAIMQEETDAFTTQQLTDITDFFSEGLLGHHKLYNFLFSQPQEHIEQHVTLQVC